MVLAAFIALVCIFAGLWTYARWHYGSLEKMGIPVVEYTNPLLGSARELYVNAGGPQDVQWMRKYGQVFGLYEGREPQILVCHPELIRLICVKDSQHFDARRHFNFGDPIVNEFPDFLPGERWRIVKSLYSYAFSSAKVKLMNLPIREATLDLVTDIKDKVKKGNGIYHRFAIDQALHTMTTEMIARAFFSIRINPDNELHKIVHEAVNAAPAEGLKLYAHSFPFLRKLFPHDMFQSKPVHAYKRILDQLMNERRSNRQKKNDLIDVFIEWWDRLESTEFKKAGVTQETLYFQAYVFIVAAQDQISTMVASVIHHMTKDPILETKIYEEIDAAFKSGNGKVDHEQLSQLPTAQACISECLRLYTIFHRGERVCTKDWRNEEFNLHIKKGTVIQIPVWAINRNGEYNENPDEFNYHRFMPENKHKVNVYASTSHGHGPRQCAGRPFVQEAMPIVLAYMLRDLKFVGRKDTQYKPLPGGFFLQPHDEILVDVLERSDKN